jgi:HSP20 family protein
MQAHAVQVEEPKPSGLETAIQVSEAPLVSRIKDIYERISHRAHELFQTRGQEHGHDLEDWLHAESELLRPVPIEISEEGNQLTVTASIPGFKAKEIEVSAEPNRLTICGNSEESNEERSEKTFYSEYRSNQVCRLVDLPRQVDNANAKATLKDGVLTVTLPTVVEGKASTVDIKVR